MYIYVYVVVSGILRPNLLQRQITLEPFKLGAMCKGLRLSRRHPKESPWMREDREKSLLPVVVSILWTQEGPNKDQAVQRVITQLNRVQRQQA